MLVTVTSIFYHTNIQAIEVQAQFRFEFPQFPPANKTAIQKMF